jgi:hypothetical protein
MTAVIVSIFVLIEVVYIDFVPVIDLAEPDLQADIMISSSMTLSLILLLPLWTMKTSWFRIDVSILREFCQSCFPAWCARHTDLNAGLAIAELPKLGLARLLS